MPKKILIEDVRSTRHGLLILPLIDSILSRHKGVKISCWVNADVAEILKDDKRIDTLLIWFDVKSKPLKYYKRQVKEIKKHHFDIVVSLSNKLPVLLIAFFAKIPNRFGAKSHLLKNLMLTKSKSYSSDLLHQSERNAQLLALIGINKVALTTELLTHENDDFLVDHYLKKIKSENKKIILIHLTKDIIENYGEEGIQQLIKSIVSKDAFSVVLSGDKLLGDIVDFGGPKILNLIDKLTRNQLVSLIKKACVSVLFCDGMAQGAMFLGVPFVYVSTIKSHQFYESGFLVHNCRQIDGDGLDDLQKSSAQSDFLTKWVTQSIESLIGETVNSSKKTINLLKSHLLTLNTEVVLIDQEDTDFLSNQINENTVLSKHVSISNVNSFSEYILFFKKCLKRQKSLLIINFSNRSYWVYFVLDILCKDKLFFYDVPLELYNQEDYFLDFLEAYKVAG